MNHLLHHLIVLEAFLVGIVVGAVLGYAIVKETHWRRFRDAYKRGMQHGMKIAQAFFRHELPKGK